MERCFDEASHALSEATELTEQTKRNIRKLDGYYRSDAWKEDFALDEAGALPQWLKRGVLSEDGIYNLLETYVERQEEGDAK